MGTPYSVAAVAALGIFVAVGAKPSDFDLSPESASDPPVRKDVAALSYDLMALMGMWYILGSAATTLTASIKISI